MAIYGAGMKGRLYAGAEKVKKAYQGNKRVYSSGNICTYHVDAGITYQEEVDEGVSCLSPKTFIPVKEGWEFVGWRQDETASSSVLTGKVMGDSPVVLYAVFRQAIILAYNGNGATGGGTANQNEYRYCNNGDFVNPSFTVKENGFTRTNYIFTGWISGSTCYVVGQRVSLSTDLTLSAQWYTASAINFVYTRSIQTYTVPATGLYLLVCRGAAGGSGADGYSGGQGGLTSQYTVLTKDTVLYVVCGGSAGRGINSTASGGYNGGGTSGSSGNYWAGGGGGATHIATKSGTLYSLGVGNKPYVLAVAGGGGGSCGQHIGGCGGGTNGQGTPYGIAGTQTSGYAFGLGGNSDADGGTGGGPGGGLYGGHGNSAGSLGGAGGSGYIMSLTTTCKGRIYTNATTQGGNSGNGSASVQLIAVL